MDDSYLGGGFGTLDSFLGGGSMETNMPDLSGMFSPYTGGYGGFDYPVMPDYSGYYDGGYYDDTMYADQPYFEEQYNPYSGEIIAQQNPATQNALGGVTGGIGALQGYNPSQQIYGGGYQQPATPAPALTQAQFEQQYPRISQIAGQVGPVGTQADYPSMDTTAIDAYNRGIGGTPAADQDWFQQGAAEAKRIAQAARVARQPEVLGFGGINNAVNQVARAANDAIDAGKKIGAAKVVPGKDDAPPGWKKVNGKWVRDPKAAPNNIIPNAPGGMPQMRQPQFQMPPGMRQTPVRMPQQRPQPPRRRRPPQPPKQNPIEKVMEEYKKANEEAKKANEARAKKAEGDLNSVVKNTQAYNGASGVGGDLMRDEINRQYDRLAEQTKVMAMQRGLSATTVLPSLLRGVEDDRQRALRQSQKEFMREQQQAQNAALANRSAFTERQTDAYPDLNQYLQLAQMLGRADSQAYDYDMGADY